MIDREVLLKARLPEGTVELPGLGEVRVRALSRAEVMNLQESRESGGQVGAEVYALARGIIDPVLTEDEARTLLEGSPGAELQPVVDAIMRLSGLTEGAQKSA